MNKSRAFLFLLVSLFVARNASSQPIERRFANYSLEDGLSQSTIFDIKQDALGYTWIATADGLNVFDGIGFEVYKKNPSDTNTLTDNFVFSVLPFNDGKVWAITQDRYINEIDIYTKKVRRITHLTQLSLGMDVVKKLMIGPDGNVWLFSTYDGIFVLNRKGGIIKIIDQASGLLPSPVINSAEMDGKYVWVATNNGVSRISKNLEKAEFYFQNRQVLVAYSFKGNLYTSFNDRLGGVYESLTGRPEQVRDSFLQNEFILSIKAQKSGTLWMGSISNGLFERNGRTIFHYRNTDKDRWSLIDNNIFVIYTDYNDDIWIGKIGRGSWRGRGLWWGLISEVGGGL